MPSSSRQESSLLPAAVAAGGILPRCDVTEMLDRHFHLAASLSLPQQQQQQLLQR